MAAPIDFWFDFSSPYSYIANEWVDTVAARHGRGVRRHAILLGATFQAAELKPPVAHPLKRDYVLHDFERSAHFEGLPYRPPPVFPVPTQNAARLFWWLHETRGAEAAAAWATAGLRAMFTQGVALHEMPALQALAAVQGVDAATVEAVCADPAWKARLKRANDEAIAAGVFGAPFFAVDGEPFWGNDRRAQLERWLAQGSVAPAEAAVDLAGQLRIQARANRLANQRLHGAMAALSTAELHAPRTGFFPSLAATLNHILAVDQYYIGALCGDAGLAAHWERFVPDTTLPALAERQRVSDERLIAFCDGLDAAGCAGTVSMPRAAGRVQRDAAAHVLAHLFMHQTHHRGQVHAMLSGTAVPPPQLDEFLMPSEAHLRSADMAALGWREADVYGPMPAP